MTNENERAQDQGGDAAGKTNDDDTQGNVFLNDPTTARELARSREREVERAARERQRRNEARGR